MKLSSIKLTFNTKQIIDVLKRNRENHIKEYEKAREKYLEQAKKKLQDHLLLISDGYIADSGINLFLQPPANMTKNYDTIISMFIACQDKEVTLTNTEYESIFDDKWDWIGPAKLLNNSYISWK